MLINLATKKDLLVYFLKASALLLEGSWKHIKF